MSGDFRTTPFARLISRIFYKGFSKEIDHLSTPGFCELQNIPDKDLKLIASSSKGIQGSRKGFRKGCARKTQGQYFRILYLGGASK